MQQISGGHHSPSGLDSSIFLAMKATKTAEFNVEREVDRNVLGKALLHWEECSRGLGYETEANEIHTLSIVVLKSANILATKSLRVNQMCRDVVCSISPNFTASLSPVLVNGCCVEIYQRLLCMLHGIPNIAAEGEKSKVSSIISFLNSDKEFLEMLKAHQNIEDSHRLLNVFNPLLKLSHSSCSFEREPQEFSTNNYLGENSSQFMGCGKCIFHCIMAPH